MVTCHFIEHDAPQLPVLLTVGLAHFNPRCFGGVVLPEGPIT